jgi:hypothetical protein
MRLPDYRRLGSRRVRLTGMRRHRVRAVVSVAFCSVLVIGACTAAMRVGAVAAKLGAHSPLSSRIEAVSCPSAGFCAAVGEYRDRARRLQGLVVDERHGIWGSAKPVPGLAALNAGDDAEVTAVSCGAPQNCAAVGTYLDRRKHQEVFVASERNGVWRKAIQIPGLAALNNGGYVYPIVSVSCASADTCAAGGAYELRSTARLVAFVVDEVQGTWGKAHRVPGIDALDARGNSYVTAIACAAPGSCTVAGNYSRGHAIALPSRVFVVVESHGTWRAAKALPGLAALHPFLPDASGISCGSASHCTIAGSYGSQSGNIQSYVAGQSGRIWMPAQHLAGPRPRRRGADLTLSSVSCAGPGECVVGGSYERESLLGSAIVAEESNGTWGRGRVLAGPGSLGPSADAEIVSVSCASARNCSAGGDFYNRSGHIRPFVVNERDGKWGPVKEVAGSRNLNGGKRAYIAAISCGAPGDCAAVGAYSDGDFAHAFVVTEQDGTWGRARAVAGP